MKIAFSIDNPQRDLKGILLISKYLIEKDHEVFLIPMHTLSIDVFFINPDVMVFNYVRPNNEKLIRRVKDFGIKTFILDTEGGVLSKNGFDSPKKWAENFKLKKYKDIVDGYFFWGAEQFNSFKEKSGLGKDSIHLTGSPRYDQCFPRWKKLIKKINENHILINTNFSSINPKFSRDKKTEKETFKSTGWGFEYTEKLYKETERVFPKFLEEIKKIAFALPKENFILRPHPFENISFYKSFFNKHNNIEVQACGEIFDATNEAKAIIHLNCGTSVDAFFLGIPSISLEYLNTDFLKKHTPLPSKISMKAFKREEVIKYINQNEKVSPEEKNNLFKMFIEPFFYGNDGLASERISKVILREVENPLKIDFINLTKGILKDSTILGFIFKFLSILLGTHLIFKLRKKFNFSLKDKEIYLEEILNVTSHLEELKSNLEISRVSHLRFATKLASYKIKRK